MPAKYCLAQYFGGRMPDSTGLSVAAEALTQPAIDVPLDPFPFWHAGWSGLYSTGMIFEDCNNDGYIDLFIANGNDMAMAPNYIYISESGTLPTTPTWSSANDEYTGHCAVGDIDDDGYVDFLVANFLGEGRFYTTNHSELYWNTTGLPETSASWRTADSMMTFSCALGDPDGDGDLDAAFATGTAYEDIYTADKIYFNVDGELQTLPGWTSTTLRASMDVTWGDVDNDGDLDLAFCYDYMGAAVFMNNGGTIENSPSWQSDDHQSANTLIFGDVNNDGWLDLIVAFNSQLGGGGYFRAYFNNGSGQLNTSAGWQSQSYGNGSGLSLYDYDSDGDMDLAAGRWFDEPRIYENIGGTFTETPVWRAVNSVVVEEMAWVDVDASEVKSYADTIHADGSRKLFYVTRLPLYSLDSILVDGEILANGDYCHDLISGWISLAEAPADSLVAYYKHSAFADLAVSNWGGANVIYANTHRVEMYADIDTGWAPLTVQFSDSSEGATEWLWDFGDGEGSEQRNPLHTYTWGGSYDVSLEVALPEGHAERTIEDMILVKADTIVAESVLGDPGTMVEVTIRARNIFPLDKIILPVEFDGDLSLAYNSFSTEGCRTAYFDDQNYTNFDPWTYHRVTIRLRTATDGSQPELPPGEGAIVKLYFTLDSEADPGTSTDIVLDGYLEFLPTFSGSLLEYHPKTVTGLVEAGCCTGIRGNVDGDELDQVTIDDIIHMVNWTFSGGPQPTCLDEADVDNNGFINIEDLVYLVGNIYGGGPDPLECY